nr:uncharacterized protein LOC129447551 [Misgurnus anguillicaudatus]
MDRHLVARMDRHLLCHSELSAKARKKAFADIKRKIIIEKLAALRADGPVVPMVSALDLQEEGEQAGEGAVGAAAAEEDPPCGSEACVRREQRLTEKVVALQNQVDSLTNTLQAVTRRCKQLLRRRTHKSVVDYKGVTRKLLEALESPAEEEEAGPSKAQCVRGQEPEQELELEPEAPREPEAPGRSDPVEDRAMYPENNAVLNELLEEFRRHQQGPEPSRKLKENVAGKVYRIQSFIGHMAEGKGRLSTLEFLHDPERIRKWLSSLRSYKVAETTLNHYLQNAAQFVKYVSETPPPTSRLSKRAQLAIGRELRGLIKGLKRGVVLHQIGVKRAKEGRLIPKEVLRKCRSEAGKLIPELLDQLERDGLQKTQFLLYGHLTAYFASIYGHRLGVFQNVTIEEVEKAVKSPSTGNHLINITFHKTNQAFGPAKLSLTPEEYGWFRRLLAMRDRLVGGPDAVFFFYTSTPNRCKNLIIFRRLGCRWDFRGSPHSQTSGPPSPRTPKTH